jgi:tetratricopeptide (TPR) repeat protein
VVLGNLGSLYLDDRRFEQARAACERAVELDRAVRNRRSLGFALGYLACVHWQTGRMAEAEPVFREALALHREAGNALQEGVVLRELAVFLGVNRRREEALQTWREGTRILEELKIAEELDRTLKLMHEECAKAGVPPLDDVGGAT